MKPICVLLSVTYCLLLYFGVVSSLSGVDSGVPTSSRSSKFTENDGNVKIPTSIMDSLEVMYIMDVGTPTDFEEVVLDKYAVKELLPWVRQLKDELTRTHINPDGHELRVSLALI
jgi:hypothetical protein